LPSTPSSSAEPAGSPPSRRALLREPRTWLLLAICIVVPVALLIVATRPDREGTSGPPVVSRPTGLEPENPVLAGDPAPTFALEALDGTRFDTEEYLGTPYIVTFWGSWCGPCKKEMPLLQQASEDHAGDLEVVGVTYQDAESDSRAFAEEFGIDFTLAKDDGYAVAKAFGVIRVPFTFFVDRQGIVQDRIGGIEQQDELDPPLDALLAPS
jgi:peroxiredoxin